MNSYVVYRESGRIEAVESVPYFYLPVSDSSAFLSGESHYVERSGADPIVLERLQWDAEFVVTGLDVQFNNLPHGTRVEVGEFVLSSDGGEYTTVSFEVPGVHVIKLMPPPKYRDLVVEVTVGDP